MIVHPADGPIVIWAAAAGFEYRYVREYGLPEPSLCVQLGLTTAYFHAGRLVHWRADAAAVPAHGARHSEWPPSEQKCRPAEVQEPFNGEGWRLNRVPPARTASNASCWRPLFCSAAPPFVQ